MQIVRIVGATVGSSEVIGGGGGEGAQRISLDAEATLGLQRKSGLGPLSQSRDARTLDCRDLEVTAIALPRWVISLMIRLSLGRSR